MYDFYWRSVPELVLPRIIGLTATLLTGKFEARDVEHRLMEVQAILDCVIFSPLVPSEFSHEIIGEFLFFEPSPEQNLELLLPLEDLFPASDIPATLYDKFGVVGDSPQARV